ncbi:MAG: ribosome silencing factor [Rhodospirillaceae bacterium TMED167]|nr:MAG: ribosome silencing factor [Rhodospirillaceae bacterium TMED167]
MSVTVPSTKEISAIVQYTSAPPISESLKETVTVSLDDDKAQKVVVIDLKGKTAIADYMIVASGTSQRQVSTMAEHLREKLKSLGIKSVSVEGMSQGDWVLIDGGDVIVHLFRPEIREFYDLERLWGDPMPHPGQAA